MNSRIELHAKLKEIIGSRADGKSNVYFQPPESIKLVYPCIVYRVEKGKSTYANDATYTFRRMYEVTLITSNPDDLLIDKLPMRLQMCTFDRYFVSDNLNHYVYTICY